MANEMEALAAVLGSGVDEKEASTEQLGVLELAGEQLAEAFLSRKEIHRHIAKKQAQRGYEKTKNNPDTQRSKTEKRTRNAMTVMSLGIGQVTAHVRRRARSLVRRKS